MTGTVVDILVAEFRGDTTHLDKSVNRSNTKIKKFSKGASGALRSLRGAFVTVTAAAAAFGVALTFKGAIEASIRMDQLANKMLAATKSAGLAADSFQFLSEVSSRLGLDFVAAADGFAGFSASALRAGLTLGETKQIFEDMATASTSLQLGGEKVGLIFRALEQIASKGVVQMEELKLQLADSLPGALEIAARSMGVTSQEFIKMVENGEVLAKDFLPKFGKTIKEELGGSAEIAATQLQAQTNRMKNAFFNLQNQFADNGAGEAYTEFIKELGNLFEDPAFIEAIKAVSSAIGGFTLEIINSIKALNEFFGLTSGGELAKLDKRIAEIQANPRGTVFASTPFGDVEEALRAAELKQLEARRANIKTVIEAREQLSGLGEEYEKQQAMLDAHTESLDSVTHGTGKVVKEEKDLTKEIKKGEKALDDILKPAEEYALTLKEIEELTKSGALAQAAANVGLSEAEAKMRLMNQAATDYTDAMEESQRATIDAKNELADFIAEGAQGFDNLRDVALRALQDILRNMLRVSIGGSAEGGIFGNIGGGLGSLISSGIGSIFGGGGVTASSFAATQAANVGSGLFGPGFATGGTIHEDRSTGGPDNQMVTLRKSKNEKLTISRPGQNLGGPASQPVVVQQTYNVSTGVEQTVRAELARILPGAIKQGSVDAVNEALSRSILKG